MAKQSKEEYKVARRKSYETKPKAVEDADPKIQRQLRQIEAQQKQRSTKAFTEKRQGYAETGEYMTSFSPDSMDVRKVLFAIDEKERRTKRAIAKSNARRKK